MYLFIARHAEDPGGSMGDENRGLTSKGVLQSKQLGEIVAKFQPTDMVTSPLPRATQTAEIISTYCGLEPIKVDLLQEQVAGSILEGTQEDTTQGYVNPSDRFLGGETYEDLTKRAKSAWKWLSNEFDYANNERRIVVITHGRFMTFFIGEILGFPVDGFFLAIANTAYLIIKKTKSWRPQLIVPVPGENYC